MRLKILFSEIMCSICCSRITSTFFNIFNAHIDPVLLCFMILTRPKDPVPSVTPSSKSARLRGVGKVRTFISVMLLCVQTVQRVGLFELYFFWLALFQFAIFTDFVQLPVPLVV